MLITGSTLFAFVDAKDPFMPSEIAGGRAETPRAAARPTTLGCS